MSLCSAPLEIIKKNDSDIDGKTKIPTIQTSTLKKEDNVNDKYNNIHNVRADKCNILINVCGSVLLTNLACWIPNLALPLHTAT